MLKCSWKLISKRAKLALEVQNSVLVGESQEVYWRDEMGNNRHPKCG
jgi:hypothetical protein